MLTSNSIRDILNGSKPADFTPVVQITSIEKHENRYKLSISDGKSLYDALYMGFEFKELLDKEQITIYHIIRIIDYCINRNISTAIIIFQFDERFNPGYIIGNPDYLATRISSQDIQYSPISNIDREPNWIIKARVIEKSGLSHYKSLTNKGTYFKIYIVDNSGAVAEGIFFNRACTKFFNRIIMGNVYSFGNGRPKTPHPLYNYRRGVVFEINFDLDSLVFEENYDCDIPLSNDLARSETETQSSVDGNFANGTDRPLPNNMQNLNFGNGADRPVAAKIHNRDPIQAAYTPSYQVLGVRRLCTEPLRINFSENRANLSTIAEILSHINQIDLAYKETYDILCTIGKLYVSDINALFYEGCIVDRCKKKVMPLNQEKYRCDKCNVNYLNFTPRYKFSLPIHDSTGSLYAKVFDEYGNTLLGVTAEKLQILYILNPEGAKKILFELFGKKIVARVQVTILNGQKDFVLLHTKSLQAGFKALFSDIESISEQINNFHKV
jgi:Replication factor-A C terminal domain/Replication factor-A protein 1, N-terminal domain